jgi:hypothetical protein
MEKSNQYSGMILSEILEKCKELNICEKRAIEDEYCELVFLGEEINKWNAIFIDIFGPAVKPKGVKPAKGDLKLTGKYGGILDGQTLFKRDFENGTIIAMFWPWQDGSRVTLKTALLK